MAETLFFRKRNFYTMFMTETKRQYACEKYQATHRIISLRCNIYFVYSFSGGCGRTLLAQKRPPTNYLFIFQVWCGERTFGTKASSRKNSLIHYPQNQRNPVSCQGKRDCAISVCIDYFCIDTLKPSGVSAALTTRVSPGSAAPSMSLRATSVSMRDWMSRFIGRAP